MVVAHAVHTRDGLATFAASAGTPALA